MNWSSKQLALHNAKANKPTLVERESSLHSQIAALCKAKGWIAFHGATHTRSFRTVGECDFTILADGGKVLFVEAKTKSGKLSIEQQSMIVHAAKLGTTIHVCRSISDFEKLL